MKISTAVGERAKLAFEQVIAADITSGITLEGYKLSFDYTGLDADAALQQAVDNQQAVSAKADELLAVDDENALAFNYALGFMGVATAQLAQEQASQQQVEAVGEEQVQAHRDAVTAPSVIVGKSPRRRGDTQEAVAIEA